MRRGRTAEEIALRLGCTPSIVFRAAARAGVQRRPQQEYQLADIAEGLALIVKDADRRSRRDAVRIVCESFGKLFTELSRLAAAIREKITKTKPARADSRKPKNV